MQDWLSRIIQKHLVQDMPPDLAFCEVGCPEHTCTATQFVSCSARARAIALVTELPEIKGLLPLPGHLRGSAGTVYEPHSHTRFSADRSRRAQASSTSDP